MRARSVRTRYTRSGVSFNEIRLVPQETRGEPVEKEQESQVHQGFRVRQRFRESAACTRQATATEAMFAGMAPTVIFPEPVTATKCGSPHAKWICHVRWHRYPGTGASMCDVMTGRIFE